MKPAALFLLVATGVLGNWQGNSCQAGPPEEKSSEEAAIRKSDDAYLQAFNAHDAKTMANAWSPDAVYLNRATGVEVVGRAAIAEQFTAYFKEQPEVKLELNVESIQFVSPNVAIENGTAKTQSPGAAADETEYSAVYVRRDGQWLLDRVTDKAKPAAPPSHYEQLKPLEWMIGRWVDKDDKADVETECKWTKNQNFIRRSFTVSVQDHIDMSGMQIIGWDASTKSIRSWTFDSSGGFTEATWHHKDDKWFIHSKGILADGRKASMVNIIKQIDANSFTWQTVDRTAGGELLPNIDEILIVRDDNADKAAE